MNLRPYLTWWRHAPAQHLPTVAAPDGMNGGIEPSAEPLHEPLPGCGWFDSSHELHNGLQVTEHLSPECVANEVPLGWWLAWQAGGAAGASVPARSR